MQSDQALDQAEGLRRLLTRPSLRVVTVVGARAGQGATSVVTNLAFALARQDRQVLLLDENPSVGNVANRLQLKPRYDLLHTVSDHMRVRSVMLHASACVHVLPVARAMQSMPAMDAVTASHLLENFNAAMIGMDVILVDAATSGHSISPSLSDHDPLLMVICANSEGITSSYAMIKQLVQQQGRRHFKLLINRVVDETEALTIFDNMSQAASRYLDVELEYAGCIPEGRAGMEPCVSGNFRPIGSGDMETVQFFSGLAKNLMQSAQAEAGRKAQGALMARLAQQKILVTNRKAA